MKQINLVPRTDIWYECTNNVMNVDARYKSGDKSVYKILLPIDYKLPEDTLTAMQSGDVPRAVFHMRFAKNWPIPVCLCVIDYLMGNVPQPIKH